MNPSQHADPSGTEEDMTGVEMFGVHGDKTQVQTQGDTVHDGAKLLQKTNAATRPVVANPQELVNDVTKALGLSYFGEGDRYDPEFVNRLPGIVNKLIQTLSRATGAVMYTIIMWDQNTETTRVYETCTDRVCDFLRKEHAGTMRTKFGNYVFESLGPTFSRSRLSVWPVVYSLPSFEFRPRLPPQHPELSQERRVLWVFFRSLAAWQGMSREIQWADVHADISGGKFEFVERQRVPTQLLGANWSDPQTWEWDVVRPLCASLRDHQKRLDQNDATAFATAWQWKEDPTHTTFRTTMHPKGVTYHESSTAYAAAMLRNQYGPNAYMSPTAQTSSLQLSPDDELVFRGFKVYDPLIKSAFELLQIHEQCESPLNTESKSEPLLLGLIPPVEHDIMFNLSHLKACPAFSTFNDKEHPYWAPSTLLVYVESGGVGGTMESGPLRRGPRGPLRVFLACCAVWRFIKDLIVLTDRNVIHQYQQEYTTGDLKPVRAVLAWLQQALEKSVAELRSSAACPLPAGTLDTAWKPKQVSYQNPWRSTHLETWRGFRSLNEATTLAAAKEGNVPVQSGALSAAKTPQAQTIDDTAPALKPSGEHPPQDSQAQQPSADKVTDPLLSPSVTSGSVPNIPGPLPVPADTGARSVLGSSGERLMHTDRPSHQPLPPIREASHSQRSHSEPRSEKRMSPQTTVNALGLDILPPASREPTPERTPTDAPGRAELLSREPSPDPLAASGIGIFQPPSFFGASGASTPINRGRSLFRGGHSPSGLPPIFFPDGLSSRGGHSHQRRTSLTSTLAGRAASRHSQANSPVLPGVDAATPSEAAPRSRAASHTSARGGPVRAATKRQRASDDEGEPTKTRRASSSRSAK